MTKKKKFKILFLVIVSLVVLFLGPQMLFVGAFIFAKGNAVTVYVSGNWNTDKGGLFLRDLNKFAVLLVEDGWEVNVDYIERVSGPNDFLFEEFNSSNNSRIFGILAEKKPLYSFLTNVTIETLYIRIYENDGRLHKSGHYYLSYHQLSNCNENSESRRERYLELARLVKNQYGVDISDEKIYYGDCKILN